MTPDTQLLSVMPGYGVKNLATSLNFYVGLLGFETVFTNGPQTAPTFAIVRRGNLEISLMLDKEGGGAGRGSSYVKVRGITALYESWLARGVPMAHELKDEEYGMREFMIQDPDGNTINFGEELPAN